MEGLVGVGLMGEEGAAWEAGEILLTGGAGYIGSHAVVSLLQAGRQVVVVDNLSNASRVSLERVEQLTGRDLNFYQADICDRGALCEIFGSHKIVGVIHFAGLKAVGESVAEPLRYYKSNVAGTLSLLEVMRRFGCRMIVFSSTAAVYGEAGRCPISEECGVRPTNPYGHSKLMIEQVLRDVYLSEPDWRVGILRYFNPAGAHESGMIGEAPRGRPSNLFPAMAWVAAGRLEVLEIFGDDYPTPDGTAIRDYLHVMDLAEGHLAALSYLESGCESFFICNLGMGRGISVREAVAGFERAVGRKIPVRVVPRRAGDVAVCFADASLAYEKIGWKARRSLEEICRDAWRWQTMNPMGYGESWGS